MRARRTKNPEALPYMTARELDEFDRLTFVIDKREKEISALRLRRSKLIKNDHNRRRRNEFKTDNPYAKRAAEFEGAHA